MRRGRPTYRAMRAQLGIGRAGHAGGFSLIELLIVLTIVAIVSGAVVVSFRSLRRATARSAAGRLGAAIRYTYDRAVTTGSYYRLVFDLGEQQYWAERSEARFFIGRDKERMAGGKGLADEDEAEREKKRKADAERQPTMQGPGAQALLPPPEPQRARFESFRDANLPKVTLRGARVRDLWTRRQKEPYTEGRAYLYFFPDGHTERALIHMADEDGDVYSLVVHPLTGRVEMKPGDVEMDHDFELDAEGRQEAPR